MLDQLTLRVPEKAMETLQFVGKKLCLYIGALEPEL